MIDASHQSRNFMVVNVIKGASFQSEPSLRSLD